MKSQEIAPFLEEWQHRVVEVPNNGAFRVPRYIVRVDIDTEPGYSGTHGWQVRYGPKPWKLFSDTLYGIHKRLGTPAESLAQAQRHLIAVWAGNNIRPPRPENTKKMFPTGMSGVRVLWSVGADMVCVRVDELNGKPLTTLYAGTHNTVRLDKLIATIKKGQQIREAYLKEAGKPVPKIGEPDLRKIATEAPLPFRTTIIDQMLAMVAHQTLGALDQSYAGAGWTAEDAVEEVQLAMASAKKRKASQPVA